MAPCCIRTAVDPPASGRVVVVMLASLVACSGCNGEARHPLNTSGEETLLANISTPGSIRNCYDKDENPGIQCVDPSPAMKVQLQQRGFPYYVGHAEPAVLFWSWGPNSASDMQWRFTLPATDPTPNQIGSSVANFELFSTFWISLVLCDPTSSPFGSCQPVSDLNNPSTAGAALMELQFYPPGFSTSSTSWSAALTIDTAHNNNACPEPIIAKNITPDGNPMTSPLLMANGHDIIVTIKDTGAGVRVDINDVTASHTGFMVASGVNGFIHNNPVNAVSGSCSGNHATLCSTDADCPAGQGTCSFCQFDAFDFHPLYSTASPSHILPWAALGLNVALSYEIGHWELCGNASCTTLPDSDADDAFCGPIRGVGGCQDKDVDQDGVSYQAKWPDGTSSHPASLVLGSPNLQGIGPMNAPTPGNYVQGYDALTFANTESTTSAAFYPFYSTAGTWQSCRLNFGNDIPGVTVNDFSKAAQYNTQQFRFPTQMTNPCLPDNSWLVPTTAPLLW
jgi:hypothetical protein